MAAITIFSDFGAQKSEVCPCFHWPSICREVRGLDATILVFWMLIISVFIQKIQASKRLTLINCCQNKDLRRPKIKLLNERWSENESHSVMSVSLWPHGLYSPWNSPGQNTAVGSLSLLQGIFSTHGLNPGLPHCRWILYQLSHQGSPRILEWAANPFSRGSSWPGTVPGSPALPVDSLPTEPSGKPYE